VTPSCLVPPVADQPVAGEVAAVRAGCGALIDCLGEVADHRSRRGLRYELGFLLAVVVAASACAGHDEVAAQAQWAADAPAWVLAALGAKHDPLIGRVTAPSESTLRRVLRDVDAADLQRLTARWAAAAMASKDRDRDRRLPGVAIDGKSVRGAAAGGGPRPHLLGAAAHAGGIVLAQHQIPNKGSEITELATLVDELDLTGRVVTVDALHTQRATAQHLVDVKGADYLMTIKANQPGLLAAAARMLSGPATGFADEHTEQSRGHGRTEQRIVRAAPVTGDSPLNFPYAAQVFRVIRYVGGLDGQRRTKEVAYCVTSLAPAQAGPEDLGTSLRRHWDVIENKLHWVRDTTFNEDASTLRAGTAPRTMAIIRNTLINAFRLIGWANLKQARRHYSHVIDRCIDLITKPLKTVKDQT
jgi:predicted transposase YbfD/YdcC